MRHETIYDIIRTCQSKVKDWQEDFKREVLGTTVLTDYNNKTYRVDDVDFKSSPNSFFTRKDGNVTYKDYYESKYNLRIKDDKQPMLVSKPKARDVRDGRDQVIFLVPELCRATGLTERMRANFQMMRAMAEHTQMDPEKRKGRLLDFAKRLQESELSKRQLDAFNTNIDTQLVNFKGRALPQESMIFGSGKTFKVDDKVDWTHPMKVNEMYFSVPLKRWVFIYPQRCERESKDFLSLMQEVAGGMNYEMTDPKIIELSDDRTGTYAKEIEAVIRKDPKLIMIVVPNNAADRYAAIKKLTCINRAIPSQVIISKTMQAKKGGNTSGVKSIATKVLVQINCKLGGAAWMLKLPKDGIMTIGFDASFFGSS